MSQEESTCDWEGCFEAIEGMCQQCRSSFCAKHLRQTQYKTADNRLAYGKYCLNCLEEVKKGDPNPQQDSNRIMMQLVVGAVIVAIVIYGIVQVIKLLS